MRLVLGRNGVAFAQTVKCGTLTPGAHLRSGGHDISLTASSHLALRPPAGGSSAPRAACVVTRGGGFPHESRPTGVDSGFLHPALRHVTTLAELYAALDCHADTYTSMRFARDAISLLDRLLHTASPNGRGAARPAAFDDAALALVRKLLGRAAALARASGRGEFVALGLLGAVVRNHGHRHPLLRSIGRADEAHALVTLAMANLRSCPASGASQLAAAHVQLDLKRRDFWLVVARSRSLPSWDARAAAAMLWAFAKQFAGAPGVAAPPMAGVARALTAAVDARASALSWQDAADAAAGCGLLRRQLPAPLVDRLRELLGASRGVDGGRLPHSCLAQLWVAFGRLRERRLLRELQDAAARCAGAFDGQQLAAIAFAHGLLGSPLPPELRARIEEVVRASNAPLRPTPKPARSRRPGRADHGPATDRDGSPQRAVRPPQRRRRSAPLLNARCLADVVWAFAKVCEHEHEAPWALLEAAARARATEFAGADVAKVIYAYGRHGRALPGELSARAVQLLQTDAAAFNNQTRVVMLLSLARTERCGDRADEAIALLEGLVASAAAALDAQSVANAVYACALLGRPVPDPLTTQVELRLRAAADAPHFTPQAVSNMFWAFVKLWSGSMSDELGGPPRPERLVPPPFEEFEAAAVGLAPRLTHADLAAVVYACGLLRRPVHAALQARLRAMLADGAPFLPSDLAIMFWAFAKVGEPAPYAELEAAAVAVADRLVEQNVSNFVYACGVLRRPVRLELTERAREMLQRPGAAGRFTPQGVANMIWGFALVGLPAPYKQLEDLAVVHAARFSWPQRCMLRQAYSLLNVQPPLELGDGADGDADVGVGGDDGAADVDAVAQTPLDELAHARFD